MLMGAIEEEGQVWIVRVRALSYVWEGWVMAVIELDDEGKPGCRARGPLLPHRQ